MGSETFTGKRLSPGIYKVYRKYRYLKHRGTLYRKYPKQIHKRRKSKTWKFFHRAFFFLHPGSLKRLRTYRDQLALTAKNLPHGYERIAGTTPLSLPAISLKQPASGKKLTFIEWIRRTRRKIRYVNARRRRLNKLKKEREQASFSRSYVRYRKIRYLTSTGRLFRFDVQAFARAMNRFLSHFGNPDMIRISVNSTVLFILAYLIVYLARDFTIAAAAGSLNISTVIYYFDVDFLIRSSQWGKDSVVVVYSTGPFVSLILSALAIIIYAGISHHNWRVRLLLLWIFCHGIIQSLGEVMIGTMLNQGFGYVITYLYLQDTGKMLLSLITFLGIMILGFSVRRIFLYSGNIYFNLLNRTNRMPFIIHQFLVPFLAGTLMIILVKQPGITGFEITVLLTMILFLLPVIVMGNLISDLYYDEEPRKIRIFWWWLLTAIVLFAAFRVVFADGVRI